MDYALTVQAPPGVGCPEATALQSAVEAQVGGLAFTERPEDALRRVAIAFSSEGPDSWHAEVTLHDADGTRLGGRGMTLATADCAQLRDPVVLVLATLIGPLHAPPGTGEEPPDPPEPPPPGDEDFDAGSDDDAHVTPETPPAPVVRLRRPRPRPPLRPAPPLQRAWLLGGGALVETGVTPLAAGGYAEAAHGWGGYSVAMFAQASAAPARVDLGRQGDAGLATAAAGLDGCVPLLHQRSPTLGLCGRAGLGVLRASSAGVPDAGVRYAPFARLGIGLQLSLPVTTRLWLRACAMGNLGIPTPRLYVRDADGAARAIREQALGAGVRAGLAWRTAL